MLTKAKIKAKSPKPTQPTASAAETDGAEHKRSQRPPVVFTAAQRRRMRTLFDKGHQRPLTAAEIEELLRLAEADLQAAVEKTDRKIKATYPELKDVDIDSLSPAELKELRERIKQKQAVASKNQNTKR